MSDHVHLCIDMQSMFADETEWHAPWLNRTLPAVEALVEREPTRTIFTRFIPPDTPEQAHGAWLDYYRRWPGMTKNALSPHLLDLVPALAKYAPPARVLDKGVYSPWLGTGLHQMLSGAGIRNLIITGGETDVCVLAAVMGAIDLGYKIILPADAVFGSADETHEAALTLYRSRFGQQVIASTVQEILDNWEDVA